MQPVTLHTKLAGRLMRRGLISVCAVAGSFLMTSCSSSPVGTPTPEASSSSTGGTTSVASSAPSGDAPQVTNPIDMAQYKQQPCSTLTGTQLEKLHLPIEGEPEPDAPTGPVCDWNAYDETGVTLRGGPLTAGSSIAGSYAKNERGGFENFEPITVAGYPGYLNWNDNMSCTASVGVRKNLLYSLVVTVDRDSSHQTERCDIAKRAVTLAMKTMSGGS